MDYVKSQMNPLQIIISQFFQMHRHLDPVVLTNLPSESPSTDIRQLTTGYVLRNASLGDFVFVRTYTYTNVDSTV